MNAGAASSSTPSAPALPAIYEAARANNGAVLRGVELTQAEAVARRKAGATLLFVAQIRRRTSNWLVS